MTSKPTSAIVSDDLPIIWKSSSNQDQYEKARVGRVFNLRRPSRFPNAVVSASNESHIVSAVKLAKEHKCRVSVRSGGHSWAAWSVRDNAILIDLGNLKQIDYDEETKVVAVSPSTTGKDLNGILSGKGRMFPGGHCPDVGVGGFLLQGGMGIGCKNWGWACQYVKAVDVVTSDGEKRHCSETEHPDLFWAARGAGPGFPAIVVRFYLQTLPQPKTSMSSAYFYPPADFKKALNWVKDIAPDFDSDTEIVCVATYPPGTQEADPSKIVIMPMFTTFKNSAEEARRALQKAEDSHPPGELPMSWHCKPTSLDQEYETQANMNPQGHRYSSDNAYVSNDADVAAVLEDAFTTLPTTQAMALWFSMNPVSRRPLPDMALSLHSDHYFALYTVWKDAKDDERCQGWVRDIMKGVERESVGAYLGDSDFQMRRTRFWDDQQAKKLMQIRREWDPEGRFCGFLDEGDRSGLDGLANIHEWKAQL